MAKRTRRKGKGKGKAKRHSAPVESVDPEAQSGDQPSPEKAAENDSGVLPAASAAPRPQGFAGVLTSLDEGLGKLELAAAGFFVVALTVTGVFQFVVVTVMGENLDWADVRIRHLVFFTAMSGAAFAAQQRKMMAIDFVPRYLPAKVRALSRVVIALFVTFVCALLVYAGHLNRLSELAKQEAASHAISTSSAMLALPIGAGLIGLHFLLQAVIDSSFIVRGKLPPEPHSIGH